VIEEAPSPVVDATLRERMGADAVAAARAVGYVGAGTVEFIVDADGRHFFLEMNTRLQVEHPVTECVTGLDLVEWQLRVAAGEPLPLAQHEVPLRGHAIELRLYAEDPYAGFAPQTGEILHWRPEQALAGRAPGAAAFGGLRIDAGIAEGGRVSPWYDAMVANLIVHGRDRPDAIRRLRASLREAVLVGPVHNGRFLHDLLDHPAFRGATMHTGLIDDWAAAGEPLLQRPAPEPVDWCLAAAVLAWRAGTGHRPASVAAWDLPLQCQDQRRTLRVQPEGHRVRVQTAGQPAMTVELLGWDDHLLRYSLDGVQQRCVCLPAGEGLQLVRTAWPLGFTEVSPWPSAMAERDPRRVTAPVAGTVAALAVQVGDRVTEGQPLVCIEAMKMEMWQHAAGPGRVAVLHVQPREAVEAGTLLAELEIEE